MADNIVKHAGEYRISEDGKLRSEHIPAMHEARCFLAFLEEARELVSSTRQSIAAELDGK
jgi:hypothetical protein